jgi:hypothetical protein
LFSIQIQITWSYTPGGVALRPQGLVGLGARVVDVARRRSNPDAPAGVPPHATTDSASIVAMPTARARTKRQTRVAREVLVARVPRQPVKRGAIVNGVAGEVADPDPVVAVPSSNVTVTRPSPARTPAVVVPPKPAPPPPPPRPATSSPTPARIERTPVT